MGIERHHFNTFMAETQEWPLLDIRSPAEFEKGHIPGARSFPLFNNQERAIIGTIYKHQGKREAVKRGLQIIGPRLEDYVQKAEQLRSEQIAMYCWRGGMRSDSMAWLLEKAGFQVHLLIGGYKAFRKEIIQHFKQTLPLIVLTGYTGSKKTALLHMLQQKGEQVIDLEGLAGHQGSSFGNQKSTGQPPTEHFQNLIYSTCRNFDLQRPIWIEDECLRIGQVSLIDGLFQQMSQAPRIFLEISTAQRIEFLVEDYGNLPQEKLIESTLGISKKLGDEKTKRAITLIEEGDLPGAVEIILSYYDRYYQKSIAKKADLIIKEIKCKMEDLPKIATELIEYKYAI